MTQQLSRTIILSSLLLLSACSFQKEPGKSKVVTETVVKEVQSGLDDEALVKKVKEAGLNFPDKLKYASILGGDELVEKMLKTASLRQLNQPAENGDTLLMMAAKAGDHEFFMTLLIKGASPYVPSLGTKTTPLDILKEKGDSWNYVRSQLSHVEERFASGGQNYAVELFMEEYAQNRFPMTKALSGHKPHIYHFIDAAESFRQSPCGIKKSLRPFLETIELLEGPIEAPDLFQFIRAMAIAEDRFAVEFFQSKMGRDFTKEERIELIHSLEGASLRWAQDFHHVFNVYEKDEAVLINEILKKNVQLSKAKVVLEEMYDPSTYNFYFDYYPEVSKAILSKINGSQILVREGDVEEFPAYNKKETEKLYKLIFEKGRSGAHCFKDE